jgi:hypothetical protein
MAAVRSTTLQQEEKMQHKSNLPVVWSQAKFGEFIIMHGYYHARADAIMRAEQAFNAAVDLVINGLLEAYGVNHD